MPLLQLLETILVIYVLLVGCVALTLYIVNACMRFLRETRKRKE